MREIAMIHTATGNDDRRWMERALDLAETSIGLASPNPAVGCVLVQQGEPVGEGVHEYDRMDHAEIAALKMAGERARGATAYITLSPCSRQGRTGPCVEALIAAGIRRVVVAAPDPNPAERDEVGHDRGVEKLRAAGLTVETGVMRAEACRINDAFAKYIRTGLPLLTLKIASSLDGRIAPAHVKEKAPFWITGEAARAEVHRMRHAADALLTGVGTVIADDPLLTDRSNLKRRRPLLRVVLDSHLRMPLDSRLVSTVKDDVLVIYSHASAAAQRTFQARGLRVERLEPDKPYLEETSGGHVSIAHALAMLGGMGITSVLVEGGARINAAVLEQNLADKLTVFYAPALLGSAAVPMVASKLKPMQLSDFTVRRFGNDFAVNATLHNPWPAMD